MKKDLLILYATNHRGVLYNILTIAAIFLALRHHMYGAPDRPGNGAGRGRIIFPVISGVAGSAVNFM